MRGYDRDEVDGFVTRVGAALDDLETQVQSLTAKVAALGGSEGEDMRAELTAVSRDVDQILQSAREAADNMRTRAAEDASKWRGEADDDCRTMRQEAEVQTFQLRKAAWEASTEMLQDVSAASTDATRLAQQDALFIRAEAEREALRLTGDARRDIEEELRAAKTEAEQTVARARAERDAILDAARQSAETAQERARALEERRNQLLGELESARSSIDELESEIDTRRQSIHNAGLGDSGVRMVLPDPEPSVLADVAPTEEGWIGGDASVRIVRAADAPPVMSQPMAFVDADELMAEVQQLRDAELHQSEVAAEPDPAAADGVIDGGEIATAETLTEIETDAQSDDAPAPVDAAESGEAAAPVGDAADASPGDEPTEESPQDGPPDPALDQLFASLRTPKASREAAAGASADVAIEPDVVAEDATEPDVVEPVAASGDVGAPVLDVDPFELRDRLLLPIENRALRGVKRTIVGLQNRVLEDLRVAGDEWQPELVMFTATFDSDIETLTNEAVVAGYAGAGEMLGLSSMPHPKSGRPRDQSGPFAAALVADVGSARDGAAASGGNTRQQSAAISRVFRSWRTDGAGRKLRDAAFAAYHEGLVRALGSVGVQAVMAVPRGRSHADCPAVLAGQWDPVHALAGAPGVPPASSGCECTVVPAGNGR